jgi:hypothetical protein
MLRYIKRLEVMDWGLAQCMIALGSCTMKVRHAARLSQLLPRNRIANAPSPHRVVCHNTRCCATASALPRESRRCPTVGRVTGGGRSRARIVAASQRHADRPAAASCVAEGGGGGGGGGADVKASPETSAGQPWPLVATDCQRRRGAQWECSGRAAGCNDVWQLSGATLPTPCAVHS